MKAIAELWTATLANQRVDKYSDDIFSLWRHRRRGAHLNISWANTELWIQSTYSDIGFDAIQVSIDISMEAEWKVKLLVHDILRVNRKLHYSRFK